MKSRKHISSPCQNYPWPSGKSRNCRGCGGTAKTHTPACQKRLENFLKNEGEKKPKGVQIAWESPIAKEKEKKDTETETEAAEIDASMEGAEAEPKGAEAVGGGNEAHSSSEP